MLISIFSLSLFFFLLPRDSKCTQEKRRFGGRKGKRGQPTVNCILFSWVTAVDLIQICVGLTLGGCQMPTEATLITRFSAAQGRENVTKGFKDRSLTN